MTDTQKFSDSQETRALVERSFINFANLELYLRRMSPLDLIDVPRVIQIVANGDSVCDCHPQSLRWCNRKTGQHGEGAISLIAYVLGTGEHETAIAVIDYVEGREAVAPALVLGTGRRRYARLSGIRMQSVRRAATGGDRRTFRSA